MRTIAIIGALALAATALPATAQPGQERGAGKGNAQAQQAQSRGSARDRARSRQNDTRAMRGAAAVQRDRRGPPVTPPGRTDNPRDAARDIAEQRGQFGRDFAARQGSERAREARERSAERRDRAFAMRDAARRGEGMDMSSDDIREELRGDMEGWRDEFRIDRASWQQLRDQWIADRDSLTKEQWAERRAQWFDVRDAWVERYGGAVRRN